MSIFHTLGEKKRFSVDFNTGVLYTLDYSRTGHAIRHVLRVFVVLRWLINDHLELISLNHKKKENLRSLAVEKK